MLNHFTKSVHSKQKHKPISHSKYSSVDFSVTNLITGNKHIKGRNMLYRINSPTHVITSNSNNNNNKHNTSSVSSEKQHHTLNHSTKGGCNSGNKMQLHLTRYFKGKNVDLTYGNIEPTSLIHKFYYLTDKTHHKTSKKPRQNQIYHNNNNNSNCKGYNNNNNMKTESSSISTTSIKPIIANFVSLRNCISMKKNCVKSRNNHNMNLNMKHLLHAQTTHTNYPKKMNVATTTNTNTTTTATIHVSDPHKLQSHTFHKYSKYKSFQSISASQTNNNSSNSNIKRNTCKQHDLTTTTTNNTQLNANNITFNSNANTISHNNITTPPSSSLEAIQNEIDRAMKSQSSKSKTKKYTILKRALESILEHCSLNHYDTALITLLERIISITQHIYTKFTSEISHLKESNDEYIKRIERITNENEEKQQNLITVYSTEIQNLKKKIEILNNHTTTSERSSCDKDKLIIQTTQNNSKIVSINKENLSDLDALYFFDKVQMCNIDKCNSNTIIPTLPLALSRTVSGVDSENNNNIIVYSCDGIHSDNNNSGSGNIKLKHKKNVEVVNVEYLNSNM